MPVQDLYGGMVQMEIPSGMTDISQFREVPDNQEVYANEQTDQSIIVEIIEQTDHAEKKQAIVFHFNQISETNDSATDDIIKVEQLSSSSSSSFQGSYVLVGRQAVAKFNEGATGAVNGVYVLMALLPIPEHSADILITMNVPYSIDHRSSSFEATKGTILPVDVDSIEMQFRSIAGSFRIVDWSIFG